MRHIRSLNLPGGDIPAEFARIALAEVKTYPGGKIKIKVIETHALIPELVLPYRRRALADIDLCCNSEYRLYEKYLSLFEQTCVGKLSPGGEGDKEHPAFACEFKPVRFSGGTFGNDRHDGVIHRPPELHDIGIGVPPGGNQGLQLLLLKPHLQSPHGC